MEESDKQCLLVLVGLRSEFGTVLQGLSIEAIEAADALVVSKNLAFANFFFFLVMCVVWFFLYTGDLLKVMMVVLL